MRKSKLIALIKDYDENHHSMLKENERITLLKQFITSEEMSLYEDSDNIRFEQFLLFLKQKNKDPIELFSKNYFLSKAKSTLLFEQFKLETFELASVNHVLKLLSIFIKNTQTSKIAIYLTEQFIDLDFKTKKDLKSIIGRINQWIDGGDFLDLNIGTISFNSLLKQIKEIYESKAVEVNRFSVNIIGLQILGRTKRTVSISGLIEFITELNKQKFDNEPELHFLHPPTQEEIKKFIDILIYQPILIPITINFSGCNLGTNGAKHLARYLRSDKTPNKLTLNLYGALINDECVSYFSEAIRSGNTKENLYIKLDKIPISETGIQKIAEAIKSGNSKAGLNFSLLTSNLVPDLTDSSIKLLADALQSQNAPPKLGFRLMNVSDKGINYLAEAVKSGKAPDNISLTITDVRVS